MASPQCTVDGNATTDGVDVAANATVTIQLADIAGVGPWLIQCVSTDDHQTASAITAGLTINSITKTATFTSPNVTDGAALIFESKVNNGKDANGRVDPSLTTRFGIYVPTDPGSLRVGAFDETTEGSASYGWTSKVNHCIRAAASGGVTPTVSGTLPITVDTSNPANAVIGINPATTLAAGSMSSADKTKLNGIGAGAQVAGVTGIEPIFVNNTDPANPIVYLDMAIEGNAPINVYNADPLNPIISIDPATGSTAGSMSAADKTKLDAANNVSTPSTLVMYDAGGGICAMNVNGCTGANLVLSADGIADITMDGNGTGNVLIPAGIQTPFVLLDTEIAGVTKSLPMHWRSQIVSGAPSWIPTTSNYAKQDSLDSEAMFYCDFELPNGVQLTSIDFYVRAAGTGADPNPEFPPTYYIFSQILGGAQNLIGTLLDPAPGTYRTANRVVTVPITGGTHTIDNSTRRYFIAVSPEEGTDALTGFEIRAIRATITYPAGFVIGLG